MNSFATLSTLYVLLIIVCHTKGFNVGHSNIIETSIRRKQKTVLLWNKLDKNDEDSFVPNKPISLPSLENPPDAGPLYNICRSGSGVEITKQPNEINGDIPEDEKDRSFMGIQPRSSNEKNETIPLLMDTGLGIFTSSLILGGSIYFILAVFLDDGNGVDPTMIPLSF